MTSEALLDRGLTQSLSREEAREVMSALLHGSYTEQRIADLLTALHHRGETTEELAGFQTALQQAAVPLPLTDREREPLVDTCGTGGDGSNTFNISTAVALTAAAAGVPVAKHGNRRVTSQCGSADILERLGIPVGHTPASAAAALRQHGFVFLLAPSMHPAMRHAAPVRRRLPFRTVFNLLGPMSNPAGARRQLLGVYSAGAVRQVAHALAARGNLVHALIVHGTTPNCSGLDELSLSGETVAAEVQGSELRERKLTPEDAGIPRTQAVLPGGDAAENEAILRAVFSGEHGIARDIVLLNAAAVFLVAGRAVTLQQGAQLAATTLDTGAVTRLVSQLATR